MLKNFINIILDKNISIHFASITNKNFNSNLSKNWLWLSKEEYIINDIANIDIYPFSDIFIAKILS